MQHEKGSLIKWLGILLTFTFLTWMGWSYSQVNTLQADTAVLQGSIGVRSAKSQHEEEGKFQPGSPVKLQVQIENKGGVSNAPGKIYIRFAFAKPLENHPQSALFETEKLELPAIEPGQKVNLSFNTVHHWPSLLDFVRYDWPMREYQAVALINGVEQQIGTLAITFSAYYYPGVKKEFPVQVPAALEPLEAIKK